MDEPSNKRSRIIVLVFLLIVLAVGAALWIWFLGSRGA